MASARHNRKRKHGRRRMGLLFKLLCGAALAAALTVGATVFFQVETIAVVGSSRYTPEEVIAASGVAVFLTGIGLDLIGLVGNTEETGPVAVQSAGTLLGLRLMMTVLPMLVLAGVLVLFRNKFVLTDARAAEISAQLHGEETHHD